MNPTVYAADGIPAWHGDSTRLRRIGCAALAAVLIALTTGCYKQTRVTRNTYPPPPPATSTTPPAPTSRATINDSATAPRRPVPPPLRTPTLSAPADNALPTGNILTGFASWYAPSGRRASNGEVYDGSGLTAAHRTLPLGTLLRVTNLSTSQSTTVRITDRGPFVHGRMLDLSPTAARSIGVYRMGVAPIRMEIMDLGTGTSPEGRWCVQVGAFLHGSNADRLRAELARQYSTSAQVLEFQGSTGMWVRINPMQSDRAHALAIVESVRSTEPDAQAWLVRLD